MRLGTFAVAIVIFSGCATTPNNQRAVVDTTPASRVRPRILEGTWRLVSFESRSGGEIRYPMGREVRGQLIYDRLGNVSAHIMDPSRPAFASGDRAAGTEAEVRRAFVGYLAYYGRYEVSEATGTVTHRIEGASFPNWIGRDQLRIFRLDGELLTITTPAIRAGGEDLVTVLVWDRTR